MSADAANVMRQALAGMLWSNQFFFFDGDNWLDEHNSNPLHSGYRNSRNSEWFVATMTASAPSSAASSGSETPGTWGS